VADHEKSGETAELSITINRPLWGLVSYIYLTQLAALALARPVHTTDCERAFSAQNVITTRLRNRVGAQHTDHLIRVSIEGGETPNAAGFGELGRFFHWPLFVNNEHCTIG